MSGGGMSGGNMSEGKMSYTRRTNGRTSHLCVCRALLSATKVPNFLENGHCTVHTAVSVSRCEPALGQRTQFQRQSSVTAFDDNHVACSDRLQVLTAPVNRCMPANADASLCAMTVTVTISLALRITTSSALVVSGADNIINLFFSFSQSAI